MRLESISLKDHPPLREATIETSSSVVVIAGANGSGKTRLKNAIAATFRSPGGASASLRIRATRAEEETAWGSKEISVVPNQPNEAFASYMRGRTRGNSYTGTAVQVDSDRSVQQIKFQSFGFSTGDPDEEEHALSYYLSPFTSRWTELVNRMHQKLASRDNKLARFVKEQPRSLSLDDALRANPDPLVEFSETFAQLLPGKTLEPLDHRSPRELHYRTQKGGPFPFTSLSSGEQEVVKVAFDLVSRKIRHSVILIDEPELHLHPTLTFRLLETIKQLGDGTNQLILFSHSADLLSTYWASGNVFFIDSTAATGNQAHQLGALANAHAETARLAGANLGLFAVGRHIVFIEGRTASADRVVYHRICQAAFPEAYLMPLGSVDNLLALRSVVDELGAAVFGVELFMVRDRDGLTDSQVATLETQRRFRCIGRRHVENYLLDASVLARVARQFYLGSDLERPDVLEAELRHSAERMLPVALLSSVREWLRMAGGVSLPRIADAGKLSEAALSSSVLSVVAESVRELCDSLEASRVEAFMRDEKRRLEESLSDGSWKSMFPGKPIFGDFCGRVLHTPETRVREAYADIAVREAPEVFAELSEIFASLRRA